MNILSRFFRRGGGALSHAQALTAIANRPMLMSPRALAAMSAGAMSMPERKGWREDGDWSPHGSKPEHLITISDGIGVIAVRGALFQRWDIYAWWWGGTGYDVIVAACQKLADDAGVREIVLDLDSPGGQCAGCWDAVDAMRAIGAKKPITAVINDDGYSATYALATSASRVFITRTGGAGSIGVRARHTDISKWNERVGVAYEEIVSGEHKADYSENAPLSDHARAEMQAEVDRLAEIFFEYVASARGLSVDQVRDMQAGIYFGPGAVAAGLCDEVGTLDSVLLGLSAAAAAGDNSGGAEDEPAPAPVAAAGSAAPVAVPAAPPVPSAAESARSEVGADFVAAVLASELPDTIARALAKRGACDQGATDAIAYAATVRDACFAAGVESLAAEYVSSNTPIATVRAQLLEAKAAGEAELVTTLPASQAEKQAGALAQRLNPSTVYKRINARK